MLPLDRLLNRKIYTNTTGSSISAIERELFSLPIRLGGLNIPIFAEVSSNDYEFSKTLTVPLAAIIATHGK